MMLAGIICWNKILAYKQVTFNCCTMTTYYLADRIKALVLPSSVNILRQSLFSYNHPPIYYILMSRWPWPRGLFDKPTINKSPWFTQLCHFKSLLNQWCLLLQDDHEIPLEELEMRYTTSITKVWPFFCDD